MKNFRRACPRECTSCCTSLDVKRSSAEGRGTGRGFQSRGVLGPDPPVASPPYRPPPPGTGAAASWPNEAPRGAGATAGLPWEMDPGEEEQLMLEQMQYEAEGW